MQGKYSVYILNRNNRKTSEHNIVGDRDFPQRFGHLCIFFFAYIIYLLVERSTDLSMIDLSTMDNNNPFWFLERGVGWRIRDGEQRRSHY